MLGLGLLHQRLHRVCVDSVDLRRQDEVALRQPVNLVGPDVHTDLAPAYIQVRVMPLSLRDGRQSIDEVDCLHEVPQGERLDQLPVILRSPSVDLGQKRDDFLRPD